LNFTGQFEARIGDREGLLEIDVDEIAHAPNLYSAPVAGELCPSEHRSDSLC
jgi:hypothetical protein